jgi:hypothetical protein
MDTEDTSATSGNASSDQVAGETKPSGGESSNGAADRDQGSGGGGENPSKASPTPDNSTSDDDGSALIKALSSGDLDSIGDDGSVKKPKAKPDEEPAAETKPAAEEPAADEKTDEPPKETAKAADEAPVPVLTPEEQAEISQAPKGYRKRLKDLLTERSTHRTEIEKTKAQVEELAPVKQFTDGLIKHASEAGLVVSREDGTIDASGLRDTIEERLLLAKSTPKQRAAYYRELADAEDPEGVPVSLPQDLKDLVDTGTIPADEAEAIARKRMLKAKQPEIEQRRQREEAIRKEQLQREQSTKAFNEAKTAGYGEIKKVAQEYINRFGEEWDPIGSAVNVKLEKLIAKTDPSAWGDLARTVIEAEVAKRKAPLRKPPTTPAPTNSPPKKEGEVMSEEEERRLLSAGKL